MIDKPAELTATEALPLLRSGALRAVTLAQACLDRIAQRDAEVRAWSTLRPEQVLAQALAADHRRAAGLLLGPLHGLPVGVKDVIATADLPTQHNSPLHAGEQPGVDAACVALLRAAGALVMGKTDTVEFAATGRRAATRHPLDPSRTPGGSSSGSAAAVADHQVPLALATQTGGSTIRPAGFCGVWAIKPTWGLASREGIKTYSPTLDTLGWMARSAADLRLLLDVFDAEPASGRGPAEPLAATSGATPGAPATGADEVPAEPLPTWAGVRIAVCRTPMWSRAEAATQAAMQRAEDLLRAAGAELVPLVLPPPFESLPELQLRIMRSEGQASLLNEYRLHGDALEASLRDQVLNTDGTTRAQLCAAWDLAAACRPRFDALAAPFDAVLAPSTPGVAPQGLQNTGDLVFNGLWTLLHVPCVNVPGCSDGAGLPVGLTLTGPRFADRRVLSVAQAFGALLADAAVSAPSAARSPTLPGSRSGHRRP